MKMKFLKDHEVDKDKKFLEMSELLDKNKYLTTIIKEREEELKKVKKHKKIFLGVSILLLISTLSLTGWIYQDNLVQLYSHLLTTLKTP